MLELTGVDARPGDAINAEISVKTDILRESSDVDSQMKIEDLEALNLHSPLTGLPFVLFVN